MTGPVDRVALDTSAAVALLSSSHPAHEVAVRALGGRSPVLTGHSLAETYSVLTRLPGDARVSPADAVALVDDTFEPASCLSPALAADVPRHLAERGVSAGAVYDALVGLAVAQADLVLLTRGRSGGHHLPVDRVPGRARRRLRTTQTPQRPAVGQPQQRQNGWPAGSA